MQKDINIETYEGIIPSGSNLIIYEKGDTPSKGIVLYGFDEVGIFDSQFNNPTYCLLGGKSVTVTE